MDDNPYTLLTLVLHISILGSRHEWIRHAGIIKSE